MPRPEFELLSPAGDMECLEYAFTYGADAVYLGASEYGMRSSCANFNAEELRQAATIAKNAGKRIYLTLNTIPTNEEIKNMPQLITQAEAAGVNAVIVADLGVLSLVKQYAPNLEVHFSTQAGVANYEAAKMAHSLGAKRVVLARELTLEDIAEIRRNTPADLELEVFVHGAMCMSVSGRCLLSNYMTGRDANRGRCAQSCRWKYYLVEEKRSGEALEIGEAGGGSYILSADDLCTAEFIDKIIDAGVSSLKIEGRAKSFYYVASATAAYRAALNAAIEARANKIKYTIPPFAAQEITKTSHRPYSKGFYYGYEGATNSPVQEGYIREWQILATVEKQEDGMIYAVQRGKFSLGEEIEILNPNGSTFSFTPENIYNENSEKIEATPHTKMKFSVKAPPQAVAATKSIIRKKL